MSLTTVDDQSAENPPDPADGYPSTELFPDLDVTVGMFHAYAGTRDAGGLAMYTQRLVERLSERTPTVLYTKDGDIKPRLKESSAEIVRISTQTDPVPDVVFDNAPEAVKGILEKCPTYAGLLSSDVRQHVSKNVDVLVTSNSLDDIVISNLVDVPTIWISHGLQRVGVIAKARERLSQSDLTVANSKNTARELREIFGYEADGIVTPGVDTDAFTPNRKPAFESEDTAILFVGRLIENKGIYDLLDALAKSSDDQTLHVVGRGQEDQVKERARELQIDDSVVFHGVVDHSNLPHYYSACDFLCNPSRYESFGMVNLEAMACGKPVISTDLEGTKEYFTHGTTGLSVPPQDTEQLAQAIETLGTSPDRQSELGLASREKALEYSWDSSAETLQELCYSFYCTHHDRKLPQMKALADHQVERSVEEVTPRPGR